MPIIASIPLQEPLPPRHVEGLADYIRNHVRPRWEVYGDSGAVGSNRCDVVIDDRKIDLESPHPIKAFFDVNTLQEIPDVSGYAQTIMRRAMEEYARQNSITIPGITASAVLTEQKEGKMPRQESSQENAPPPEPAQPVRRSRFPEGSKAALYERSRPNDPKWDRPKRASHHRG